MLANILFASFLSLQAADLGTTCAILHRQDAITWERNPPLPNGCLGVGVVKAGVVTGVVVLVHRQPKGWKRVALWATAGAISSVPVVLNLRTIRRLDAAGEL